MEKTKFFKSFSIFFLIISLFFISSCDDDAFGTLVDESDVSAFPDCFNCLNGRLETSFCYSEIRSAVANNEAVLVPEEFQSILEVAIEDYGILSEEQIDDIAAAAYGIILYAAVESGYNCMSENPCECQEGQRKITICHFPNNSAANAQTIQVSCRSLSQHFRVHADFCGSCEAMNFGIELDMNNLEEYLIEQICSVLDEPGDCSVTDLY